MQAFPEVACCPNLQAETLFANARTQQEAERAEHEMREAAAALKVCMWPV
jgi:hypothetical protein